MPVVEGDHAVVGTARDARRSGILLAAAQPVGEGVVGGHVIHGGGRLRVPVAPRHAAVADITAPWSDTTRMIRGCSG